MVVQSKVAHELKTRNGVHIEGKLCSVRVIIQYLAWFIHPIMQANIFMKRK